MLLTKGDELKRRQSWMDALSSEERDAFSVEEHQFWERCVNPLREFMATCVSPFSEGVLLWDYYYRFAGNILTKSPSGDSSRYAAHWQPSMSPQLWEHRTIPDRRERPDVLRNGADVWILIEQEMIEIIVCGVSTMKTIVIRNPYPNADARPSQLLTENLHERLKYVWGSEGTTQIQDMESVQKDPGTLSISGEKACSQIGRVVDLGHASAYFPNNCLDIPSDGDSHIPRPSFLSHSRFMVAEVLVVEYQRKKKRDTNMYKDNFKRSTDFLKACARFEMEATSRPCQDYLTLDRRQDSYA